MIDDRRPWPWRSPRRELYRDHHHRPFCRRRDFVFDDAEQFLPCKRRRGAACKASQVSAAWVEVTESHHIPDWPVPQGIERQKAESFIPLPLGPGRDQGRSGQAQPRQADASANAGPSGERRQSARPRIHRHCAPTSPTTRPPPCRKFFSPARARSGRFPWWNA